MGSGVVACPEARRMSSVVENPASMGIRTTRPPRASTTSRPTMLSAAQSAPFTSTSGCSRTMRPWGVSSSKITAASTQESASRTSTRSRSGFRGRVGPLFVRTDRSELTPTTSASPRARAAVRYRTWPGCTRSKTPLVKTTVPAAARVREANARAASSPGAGPAFLTASRPDGGPAPQCGCRRKRTSRASGERSRRPSAAR